MITHRAGQRKYGTPTFRTSPSFSTSPSIVHTPLSRQPVLYHGASFDSGSNTAVLSPGGVIVPSGTSNRLVILKSASTSVFGGDQVSSATINGSPMTSLLIVQDDVVGPNNTSCATSEIWYYLAPPDGVLTCTVNYNMTVDTAIGVCEVYSNVDQTTPFGQTATGATITNSLGFTSEYDAMGTSMHVTCQNYASGPETADDQTLGISTSVFNYPYSLYVYATYMNEWGYGMGFDHYFNDASIAWCAAEIQAA